MIFYIDMPILYTCNIYNTVRLIHLSYACKLGLEGLFKIYKELGYIFGYMYHSNSEIGAHVWSK